jgi:hypothetical protein
MAYANVSAVTGATICGYPMHFLIANKVAQNDVVTVFDKPGIVPFLVMDLTNAASLSGGTQDWWEYTTVRNTGGELSTSAAIEYDGAVIDERTTGGYYMLAPASGEIFYVKADSGHDATSGNLTGCIRGALGTTAADIANDDYMFVMNSILLKGANVGKVLIGYFALPDEPKANFF